MPGLEEFALGVIYELVASAIAEGVSYAAQPYFQRRRIKRRVEDATAEIVEPLLPFLSQERISEQNQRLLIQTCVDELRPLTGNPERLFQGSLNGQVIFEELYAERGLPQGVTDEGLGDVYALLCPRIATLLCKIPAAVRDWESEAWSENYRRFDEIAAQLRALFTRVDGLATSAGRAADETLVMVRRSLAQRIGFELDLTGLRADRPLAGKFEDYFVHPEIKEDVRGKKREPKVSGSADESLALFVGRGRLGIVTGPAGSGKSTWSKWLQRETLGPGWDGVSVRVELRRLSGEELPSLHELVREAAGKHLAEELSAKRIGRWLDAERVLFTLDGFDEIRPGRRDEVYSWIADLQAAARRCPFVLTSRPLTTDHLERLGGTWTPWTIEPFDEGRVIDYIQRWHAHTPLLLDGVGEIDAPALAAGWQADPTVGPLTGNPLLLSTLLMVHHLDGSLPGGRSQLYRRYVDGMLGLWDDRRGVAAASVPLDSNQKRQILRGLALQLFLQAQDQVDEPAAADLVQGLLSRMRIDLDPEAVLGTLRERTGLIVGPGVYSFVHKSIAEYLVAETVLEGDYRDDSGERLDRLSLVEHRQDDRWNTVTFLWAGLAPVADVEAFIDACLEAGTFDLGYGILWDQRARIPAETFRRLLPGMAGVPGSRDGVSYWVTSGPRHMLAAFPIPTSSLRGLSGGYGLDNIIEHMVVQNIVTWPDAANVQGEVRDLLWMFFAVYPQGLDDWRACLASACPAGGDPLAWLFWAAECVCRDALAGDPDPDIKNLMRAYKEARPEARGLVPLALISVGLGLVGGGILPAPRASSNSWRRCREATTGRPRRTGWRERAIGHH